MLDIETKRLIVGTVPSMTLKLMETFYYRNDDSKIDVDGNQLDECKERPWL